MNKIWNKIKRPLIVILFGYGYWVITGHISNTVLLIAIMSYIEIFVRKKKAE